MENRHTPPAPVDQFCRAEYDKLKQELKYALDVLSDCAGQFFLDADGCLIADLEKKLFALLVKHKRMERVSSGSFRMLPNPLDQDGECIRHDPDEIVEWYRAHPPN